MPELKWIYPFTFKWEQLNKGLWHNSFSTNFVYEMRPKRNEPREVRRSFDIQAKHHLIKRDRKLEKVTNPCKFLAIL